MQAIVAEAGLFVKRVLASGRIGRTARTLHPAAHLAVDVADQLGYDAAKWIQYGSTVVDASNPNQPPEPDSTSIVSTVLWQAAAPFAQASDSLVAHAYETLWKEIVEGERQPGERLIDAELVAELGISRTPIRHALYQLEQAGLVETSRRRGFHVVIFSVDDVRELYDLRIILETAAVRAATTRIPETDLLAALEEIQRLQHMPEPKRSPLFLASDMRFHHQLLADNSGNRRLAEAIAQQRARMSIFLARGTRLPDANTTALREHQAIVQALLARDEADATGAMERHLQRVKEDALREFASVRRPRVRRLRSSTAG